MITVSLLNRACLEIVPCVQSPIISDLEPHDCVIHVIRLPVYVLLKTCVSTAIPGSLTPHLRAPTNVPRAAMYVTMRLRALHVLLVHMAPRVTMNVVMHALMAHATKNTGFACAMMVCIGGFDCFSSLFSNTL